MLFISRFGIYRIRNILCTNRRLWLLLTRDVHTYILLSVLINKTRIPIPIVFSLSINIFKKIK